MEKQQSTLQRKHARYLLINSFYLAISEYFSFDSIAHLSFVILSNKGNITGRAKEKVFARGKDSQAV